MPDAGDFHGYRAGTSGWRTNDVEDVAEGGGGGGSSLTGWETDEDGVLTGEIGGDPRFVFDDLGLNTGVTPTGPALRQYVDQVTGGGGHTKAYIEARDEDPLVVHPYARLMWGYEGSEDLDGFIQLEIANEDNTVLLNVFRADIEGTTVTADGNSNAALALYAKGGIAFRSHGSQDNWTVDEIGNLRPSAPGNALSLPVKAGAFSDEDYEYGVSGMVGVDTTGERLMVRVGEAWFYVDLTPVAP